MPMKKKELIEIIKKENNPVIINNAIMAMQTDPRLKVYEQRFMWAAQNGKGRLKRFFSVLCKAMIFDKSAVCILAGKSKTGQQIDSMLDMIKEQIDGAYVDIGKRHGNFIKLGYLLDQGIKSKLLPLKDEDGDSVPIYPRYTLYSDYIERIEEVIKIASNKEDDRPLAENPVEQEERTDDQPRKTRFDI